MKRIQTHRVLIVASAVMLLLTALKIIINYRKDTSSNFSQNDVKVSFTGQISLEKDYDTYGYPTDRMNMYLVEWLVENNSNEDLLLFRPKESLDEIISPSSEEWTIIYKNSSKKLQVLYMVDNSIKEQEVVNVLKQVRSEYEFTINEDEVITGTVVW